MTTKKADLPPADLGEAGREFWRSAMADHELTPDARVVLRAVCAELDLIGRLEADMSGQETTVRGSMGQPTANGLLGELRQHRALVATLLARLNKMGLWPAEDEADEDDGDPDRKVNPLYATGADKMSRSQAGKAAAAVRWGR